MSPIIRVGERCERCHQRPVWDAESGLCSPCWHLTCAFGAKPEQRAVSPFDALVLAGSAHPADSPEFDRMLHEWLS